MQLVYHMGAHCTDEDRLLRGLLKDRGRLAGSGVQVPAPGRYRPLLLRSLAALKGAPAPAAVQEELLDAMLDGDHAGRLVLSHEFLLCIPMRVVSDQGFYAAAARRCAAIANLFPEAECEFHIALRNPATLVPALVERISGASYGGLMGDTDPTSLRWAPVIRRIRETVPRARLSLWCNEDTPLIWPEVLARVGGIDRDGSAGLLSDGGWSDGGGPMAGAEDLLATIMTPAGMAQMRAGLAPLAADDIEARRDIVSACLERHARPGAIEVSVDLPGWTDALIAAMTAAYEDDIAEIATIDGVEMILP